MPRPRTVSSKNHRRHVVYPGVLAESARLRWTEFRYPSFPPYALELICFDLRRRSRHWITQPFSLDNREVQDALTPLLIQNKAIERWNSTLPQFTGDGAVPFINLKDLGGGSREGRFTAPGQ